MPPDSLSFSRRAFLERAGGGLGWLACAAMLHRAEAAAPLNPLAAKIPHFFPRAKSVIWIFTNGGPSHVDTWDYKPELNARDGQSLAGFDTKTGFFPDQVGPLMRS